MILAWLGAILVGLSLGLLGSGGSILTVPILIYLVGQPDKLAIASSLAIVGGISTIGGANYARQNLVSWRHVLLFGVPGILGSYGGAALSHYVLGAVQLIVFAVTMGVASYSMLKSGYAPRQHEGKGWELAVSGLGVGLMTGFVGVGGGFLIVPALVMLGGLSMHKAVGSSLTIIVLSTASGFYKHVELLRDSQTQVPWHLILLFIGLGAIGSIVGNLVAQKMSHARLRRVFVYFLIAMACYILWHSIGKVI